MEEKTFEPPLKRQRINSVETNKLEEDNCINPVFPESDTAVLESVISSFLDNVDHSLPKEETPTSKNILSSNLLKSNDVATCDGHTTNVQEEASSSDVIHCSYSGEFRSKFNEIARNTYRESINNILNLLRAAEKKRHYVDQLTNYSQYVNTKYREKKIEKAVHTPYATSGNIIYQNGNIGASSSYCNNIYLAQSEASSLNVIRMPQASQSNRMAILKNPMSRSASGRFLPIVQPPVFLTIEAAANGVKLNWMLTSMPRLFEPPVLYELYNHRVKSKNPPQVLRNDWSLVGKVQALPLPMSCDLGDVAPGHVFHFVVRSVDAHNRFSEWSNIVQAMAP